MKNFSKIINKKYIIEFIKQNYLIHQDLTQDEIDNTKFIFSDCDDNYFQCFFSGNTQKIMRYNDYFCEISDLDSINQNLSQPWKDFLFACMTGKSNGSYTIINLKDCVASYMVEFDTNIVADSEIKKWSDFLQYEMTNNSYNKAIVLNGSEAKTNLIAQEDDLITPVNNGYILNDDTTLTQLNEYLYSSLNDEIFDDYIRAQAKFNQYKYLTIL